MPPPDVDEDAPLQMQVVALQYSEFVGKIAIGKVFAGKIKKNQKVSVVKQKDGSVFPDTVVQVLEFDRLAKREVDEIRAGDICAIVGIDDADIGDTICEFDKPRALPPLTIDEPTLDMVFRVNDSPFAGQDGKPLTSRELRDRLNRELQHNVALRVQAGRARERVHRQRPRAAAPRRAARNDPPRGRRGRRRQAAGHHQGDRRAEARADTSTSWWKCRTTTRTR